jgi:hypothetical protein
MDALLFWILAAGAIIASVLVIGQRNPMYSVLLLIASFGALSGLYVLLGSPFIAVIQIIIYAGAIMVLFLFVVMLLNVPTRKYRSDVRRGSLVGLGRGGSARCSLRCWRSNSTGRSAGSMRFPCSKVSSEPPPSRKSASGSFRTTRSRSKRRRC